MADNTLKRLLGILPYNSQPRISTLNILARYLSYESWELMINDIEGKISDFNVTELFLDCAVLAPETEIEVGWAPDRKIIIKHIKGGNYEVIFSGNSKLCEGDILELSQLAIGFPFIVKSVKRSGENLGNYIAGSQAGINFLKVLS